MDTIFSAINKFANILSSNKKVFSNQEVLAKLVKAEEQYPNDLVIKNMGNIIAQRITKTPHGVIEASEIETIYNDLYNLHSTTAFNDVLSELRPGQPMHQTAQTSHPSRVDCNASVREVPHMSINDEKVKEARNILLSELKNIGLTFAQTEYQGMEVLSGANNGMIKFAVDLYSNSNIPKVIVPIFMQNSTLLKPDTILDAQGNRYTFDKSGATDLLSMYKGGVAMDQTPDVHLQQYAEEIRDVPVNNKEADEILKEAYQKIGSYLHENKITPASVKFAGIDINEEDSSAQLKFALNIHTPSGQSTVYVPMVIEEKFVYPPTSFHTAANQILPLTAEDINKYALSHESIIDSCIPIEARHMLNVVREISAEDNSDNLIVEARDLVRTTLRSTQLPIKIVKFADVQKLENGDGILYFKGMVQTPKGEVEIIVPTYLLNRKLATADFFFAEGGKYQFSKDGVNMFIKHCSAGLENAESKFWSQAKTNKFDDLGQLAMEIKANSDHADVIYRNEAPENIRTLKKENTEVQTIVNVARRMVQQQFVVLGASNPQTMYKSAQFKESDGIITMDASFNTSKGMSKVSVLIPVENGSVLYPHSFTGEDGENYNFNHQDYDKYIYNKMETKASKKEEELINSLYGKSFNQLKDLILQAHKLNDNVKINQCLNAIKVKHGEPAYNIAKMECEEIIKEAGIEKQASSMCRQCPFYQSNGCSDHDRCLKFCRPTNEIEKTANGCLPQHIRKDGITPDPNHEAIMTSIVKFR